MELENSLEEEKIEPSKAFPLNSNGKNIAKVLRGNDELRLQFDFTTFIINNNLSFSLATRLYSLLQSCLQSYSLTIIKNTQLNDNKVSTITHYLGQNAKDRIYEGLRKEVRIALVQNT